MRHDDVKRDAKIDAWIASVEQLREVENAGEVRRQQCLITLPTVQENDVDSLDSLCVLQFKPKNRFPSLDTLMQEWPEELEPLVRNLRVAHTHVPVDLNTLCRGLCNVLDIPVYEDLVESLHWLFMLYLELQNSEVVNNQDTMGSADICRGNFINFA
ncbi:MAG: hypothetical protein HC767_01005 [Akkermansiaceae bacterium]|nr:hypothetical protein [Akkermansiaceae bacterium]